MDSRDRYRGALLGLAAGDALGTTLEFKRPGTFAPITDLVGGGPFGLKPGQWTDDTSMALCLAESLIECQGFHPVDQSTRSCRWYREGAPLQYRPVLRPTERYWHPNQTLPPETVKRLDRILALSYPPATLGPAE